jgi:hypothetical protein
MLYNATGKYFFGEEFNSLSPITVDLQKITNTINLSEFDTIIFCESIEHVPEINFWNFWDKVKHEFNGRIIITNWIEYHPIPINPPEHIFEINDAVYDRLIQTSRKCIYRNKSHLVIEM